MIPHIVDWWYNGARKFLQFDPEDESLGAIADRLATIRLQHGTFEPSRYAASDGHKYQWYCSISGFWPTLDDCRREIARALDGGASAEPAFDALDGLFSRVVLVEPLQLLRTSIPRLETYLARIETCGGRIDNCLLSWRVGVTQIADNISLDAAGTLPNDAVLSVLKGFLSACPAGELDVTFGAIEFQDVDSLRRFAAAVADRPIPLTPCNVRPVVRASA